MDVSVHVADLVFFFSSRRRHTRFDCDWSSDVCSSDLMRVRLSGAWGRETQDIAAGALFVPIAQALARLLMHLLEPQAPDSFAAWGLFDACFEHKEYLEPYVAEQIARTVLAQHPQLQDEFARKLEEDPAFAANPAARREFFLRRHPSWDSHLNLYPIFRVDELLAAASPVRS